MKLVIVLRALAGLSLIVALILFILHFTSQYDIFWYSCAIACSAVFNLIASLKYLAIRKADKNNKEKNTYENNQNK